MYPAIPSRIGTASFFCMTHVKVYVNGHADVFVIVSMVNTAQGAKGTKTCMPPREAYSNCTVLLSVF